MKVKGNVMHFAAKPNVDKTDSSIFMAMRFSQPVKAEKERDSLKIYFITKIELAWY